MAKRLPEVIQLGPCRFERFRKDNLWRMQHERGALYLFRKRGGWMVHGEVLPGEAFWDSRDVHPTPREAMLAHLHLQLRRDQEGFSRRHLALTDLLKQVAKGEEQ